MNKEERGSLTHSKNEKTWNVSRGLFKRLANKELFVESRDSVTLVTFTAVKQSTNGLGAHWGMRWQLELYGGGKGSGEYIGTYWILVLWEARWGGHGLRRVVARVTAAWHWNPTLTLSPVKWLCLLGHPWWRRWVGLFRTLQPRRGSHPAGPALICKCSTSHQCSTHNCQIGPVSRSAH